MDEIFLKNSDSYDLQFEERCQLIVLGENVRPVHLFEDERAVKLQLYVFGWNSLPGSTAQVLIQQ
jgi:hypothetical protein